MRELSRGRIGGALLLLRRLGWLGDLDTLVASEEAFEFI
jgi:hypothetical protein